MPSVYNDTVRAEDMADLVAASTHYLGQGCTSYAAKLPAVRFRNSQSWADLLRSCRRRGMTAPVLTVGDGALGFWKALREVFPATRE